MCAKTEINDDQGGMSRLEDHYYTHYNLWCHHLYVADICMQKTGLAVSTFLIISYAETDLRWHEDETCAIAILRQWKIL